jgi:hypothetical protein
VSHDLSRDSRQRKRRSTTRSSARLTYLHLVRPLISSKPLLQANKFTVSTLTTQNLESQTWTPSPSASTSSDPALFSSPSSTPTSAPSLPGSSAYSSPSSSPASASSSSSRRCMCSSSASSCPSALRCALSQQLCMRSSTRGVARGVFWFSRLWSMVSRLRGVYVGAGCFEGGETGDVILCWGF